MQSALHIAAGRGQVHICEVRTTNRFHQLFNCEILQQMIQSNLQKKTNEVSKSYRDIIRSNLHKYISVSYTSLFYCPLSRSKIRRSSEQVLMSF